MFISVCIIIIGVGLLVCSGINAGFCQYDNDNPIFAIPMAVIFCILSVVVLVFGFISCTDYVYIKNKDTCEITYKEFVDFIEVNEFQKEVYGGSSVKYVKDGAIMRCSRNIYLKKDEKCTYFYFKNPFDFYRAKMLFRYDRESVVLDDLMSRG